MTSSKSNEKRKHIIFVMIIYLAGIFMGAIDTGIVTPARTLIQNNLGVNEQTGIWMITIYTLAYAASIPIMGKIADKYGRKYIYLLSILLFGFGSLFSGLSQYAGSFTMLLISRAVQAIGGGGIMPIATAEFGTTFPKEKRGLALGLVGGVYGIANIFGATAGSSILDIFGHSNWSYIFFVNIPITIFIIIAGLIILPNHKSENVKKIDYFGILFLTLTILSLLYSLRSINFLHFWTSIKDYNVWVFFLIAIILLPIFLIIESKVEDPVLNLSYFKNRQIVITLILAFVSGVVLIGAVFVPQFSENSVRIASGSGGYFVMVLGFFAGIGAPLSGRFIDKFGVKPVLGLGFISVILATIFLIFVAIPHPSTMTVIIGLVLMGFGMGFSLGTPLNYMMLEHTDIKQSNSALATLSLVRAVGTTIAPQIMVAFLASAGLLMSGNIKADLPTTMTIPPVEYASNINTTLAQLKQNPQLSDQFKNFTFPDFSKPTEYPLDSSGATGTTNIDPSILAQVKDADVTTIAKSTHDFYSAIFNQVIPPVVSQIQANVQTGIDSVNNAITQMNGALAGLNATLAAFNDMHTELAALPQSAFNGTPITQLVSASTLAEVPNSSLSMLDGITTLGQFDTVIQTVTGQITGLNTNITELQGFVQELQAFKADISVEFNKGVSNYLTEISNRSSQIENTFQSTLNIGFKNIYITIMITAASGFVILQFYHGNKKKHIKAQKLN